MSEATLATAASQPQDAANAAVPRHVALVMDGNGRWAKQRYMPRYFGHKSGVDALVRVINTFADRGVEYLTVFAFSSENWKRPADEVSGLMGLVLVAVSKYLTKLAGDGVRIRIVGDREAVSEKLRKAWDHAEETHQEQHAHQPQRGLQLRRPLGRDAGLPPGAGRRSEARATGRRLAVGPHGHGLRARP